MDVSNIYCARDKVDCIITATSHDGRQSMATSTHMDYTVMIVYIICVYMLRRYCMQYIDIIMDFIDGRVSTIFHATFRGIRYIMKHFGWNFLKIGTYILKLVSF